MYRRNLLAAIVAFASACQWGQCADVAHAAPPEAADMPNTSSTALEQATFDLISGWAGPDRAVAQAPLEGVAQTIGRVAESEPPVEDAVPRGYTKHARPALYSAAVLAGLGYFEGVRFAAYVDDGRCNDLEWRRTDEGKNLLRFGDCDHSRAYSLWQVWPSTWRGATATGMHDRATAARTALAIARESIRVTGSLCRYSGEPYPHCPKARERERYIDRAYARLSVLFDERGH